MSAIPTALSIYRWNSRQRDNPCRQRLGNHVGGPNDTITVGNGDDTIISGVNSKITAGNGNDSVTAGANSTIKVGNGTDTVTGGANSMIKATGEFQLVAGLPIFRRVRGASAARRRLIWSMSNCCGSKSPPHHSRSSL